MQHNTIMRNRKKKFFGQKKSIITEPGTKNTFICNICTSLTYTSSQRYYCGKNYNKQWITQGKIKGGKAKWKV